MSPDETATAMVGFTASFRHVGREPRVTRRGEFRLPDRPQTEVPVRVYFAGTMGLQCIALDALCGPQVTMEGIRLVGRTLPDLEVEMHDYAAAHDHYVVYYPAGAAGTDEIIVDAQCAGDTLLTRPIFAVLRERANTLWDSIPADALCASRGECEHRHKWESRISPDPDSPADGLDGPWLNDPWTEGPSASASLSCR
ncbi:hypothetical protein OHA21_17005 [Actinoplanes sp. NBC_00393]|uniref:hypothetical protein n=1 Tax=Actinoplanes sp. NBC_00393 TaxID=2975953 RepID=UPI002E1F1788